MGVGFVVTSIHDNDCNEGARFFVRWWLSTYYAASMGVGFVVANIHPFVMIEMKRLNLCTTPPVWGLDL